MANKKQKFIAYFNNHTEYSAFTESEDFITPNVSLCVAEWDVHYNPVVAVTGVALSKNSITIGEGLTETLTATVLPEDATNKRLTWSSSDESIATVEGGVVTAVGEGDATITVTTVDGGYTAQCEVSIRSTRKIYYSADTKLNVATNFFTPNVESETFNDGVGVIEFASDLIKTSNGSMSGRTSLTNIELPNSVTILGGSMFSGCTSLTSIVVPNSVTTLGSDCFNQCTSLTSVTLSESLTLIETSVFFKCTGLTSVGVVGSGASVEIPNSVTNIRSNAFNMCSGLTSVNIPDSVTTIGQSAFNLCKSLTNATIGTGITEIYDGVFGNCASLTSLTITATTPPTIGYNVLFGANNCVIYVPAESVEAYKAAEGWSSYASKVQAIP